MGRHLQKGFTIIEVMLVLAITSLMLSAVLNNSSRRVNEQHYREGVESFRDFLAGTFEDIDSVKNDVLGQIKRCNSSPFAGDNTVAWRGSAECFYSGREVTITYDRSSGSTKLTSRSVKAFIDPSGAIEPQYIAVMDAREANLREQDIDWGVGAMQPKPHSNNGYSNYKMRIIRNPKSGAKIFQIQDSAGGAWRTPENTIIFCMKNPFYNDNQWQMVTVDKNAINSSGITTNNGRDSCGVNT